MSATETLANTLASANSGAQVWIATVYSDGKGMMGQLFDTFNNQFLPQIAQWLSITKDYFFDLFGRYVTYLIITDTIEAFYSIVMIVLVIILWKKVAGECIKNHEKAKETQRYYDWIWYGWAIAIWFSVTIICCCFIVVLVDDIKQLSLSITVPELRIYQEIQSMR